LSLQMWNGGGKEKRNVFLRLKGPFFPVQKRGGEKREIQGEENWDG